MINLIFTIFLINFISVQSSKNFGRKNRIFTELSTDAFITTSEIPIGSFGAVTLMIDFEFQSYWPNLLSILEDLLPKTRRSRLKYFPFVDPQIKLINGIKNNDPKSVKVAIEEEASFLKIDGETGYYPIEYAVAAGKLRALKVMLDQMTSITQSYMNDFLGGLLIKAVQASHFNSIKFLIRNYRAPYLQKSYLLQKAIMHHSSVDIIEYLMKKFRAHPELFELYGKNNDSLLHLAIKFNNFEVFSFFYYHESIEKNIRNANALTPIDLLASLPFKSLFIEYLTKNQPDILPNWTDRYGNNLLHLAVLYNSLGYVRKLIELTDFPLNCKNDDNLTALLISYLSGKQDISLYLIKQGADLFHKNNLNKNILIYAINEGDFVFLSSCLELIDITDQANINGLNEIYEQLIKENKSEALFILLEHFPFLFKGENI